YRYQVESILDPATGKRRSRWTYLGRAEPPDGSPVERPKRRTDARERLLDALERLLDRRDFGGLTAGQISAEAGLAHGTFYRHFRDKRDALRAGLERVRERRGPVVEALRDDVVTEAEARTGIGAMVGAALRSPAQHPALLRAFYALAERDPELALERRERKARITRRIAEHLAVLSTRGLARVRDPETTAAAILAMIDGFFRDALVDGATLDDARIAGAIEVAERAVFAAAARKESP
ncbi:MAG: TetR/AcrR family transcriptional regulator, partial [Candidatus Elarobacter sp.]